MVHSNALTAVLLLLHTLAPSHCGAFTPPATHGRPSYATQLRMLDLRDSGANTPDDDSSSPHFFEDEECYDLCEITDIPIPPLPTRTTLPLPTPRSPSKVIANLELRLAVDDSGEDCDVEDLASCPVCDEDSAQVCRKCMGSGWIARWRMSKELRP